MASAFGALTTDIWTSEKASIRPDDFKQQVKQSMSPVLFPGRRSRSSLPPPFNMPYATVQLTTSL